MVHYPASYKYGKAQEAIVLPVLQEFFKRDIIATTERFDPFDFYDDKYNYEMKSRMCKMKAYPDTMITCNKLERSGEKPLVLLFNFFDKLCYIEYDPELFKNFRKILFSRASEDWDKKEHIFIPTEHLKLIKEWSPDA
jgi:hypothetical protein